MSGKQGEWSRIGVNGGVCKGECIRRSLGNEPLTLTRCHNCGWPHLYEAFVRWKLVLWLNLQLKGIKGKCSVFFFFLKLCFSFTVAHFLA